MTTPFGKLLNDRILGDGDGHREGPVRRRRA